MPQDSRTSLESIRAEIDNLPSPEFRLIARYVEALHAEQTAQIADMSAAFRSAGLVGRIVMWLAVVGGGIAAMWAAAHGKSV